MTDVWISMGEKNKNNIKYFKKFKINNKIINNAAKNVIFMHCLPAKRGQEVASEVLDVKNLKYCYKLKTECIYNKQF